MAAGAGREGELHRTLRYTRVPQAWPASSLSSIPLVSCATPAQEAAPGWTRVEGAPHDTVACSGPASRRSGSSDWLHTTPACQCHTMSEAPQSTGSAEVETTNGERTKSKIRLQSTILQLIKDKEPFCDVADCRVKDFTSSY